MRYTKNIAASTGIPGGAAQKYQIGAIVYLQTAPGIIKEYDPVKDLYNVIYASLNLYHATAAEGMTDASTLSYYAGMSIEHRISLMEFHCIWLHSSCLKESEPARKPKTTTIFKWIYMGNSEPEKQFFTMERILKIASMLCIVHPIGQVFSMFVPENEDN